MGKKDGNRKRKAEEVESENEEEDAELQAELAAVLAARQEKKDPTGEAVERVTMYNKEGMLKCVEELDTGLSFAETLVVCEFHANIINENDDIEREVRTVMQILMNGFSLPNSCFLFTCRWRFTTKP